MSDYIDHNSLYKTRLLEQFKQSSNLIGLIDALQLGQEDLETTLHQMLTLRSINTAEGAQLDIIGEILGQSRDVVNATDIPFFGYENATELHDGYGTESSGEYGARYKLLAESTGTIRTLSDTEYRVFLKAKVYKNVSILTINDMILALTDMFDATVVVISEISPKNIAIAIASPMPTEIIALVTNNDVIPRPAGVGVDNLQFAAGDGTIFAFLGFVGGGTFGTLTNPTVGGTYQAL